MLEFLNKWKWYALAFLFLVYSVGVWNVSGTYATSTLVQQELTRTQNNEKIRVEVAKIVQEGLDAYKTTARKSTEDIINEVLKDPVYKSCRVTDGVRDAIKRKLASQP